MECQHPKVFLLQNKLALVMGPAYCPIYDTIMAQYPHALEEPWSATMSEPYIHVVFDNKTFMMHQVSCPIEGFEYSFQPDPIDCGENIKLYLNDNLFRDLRQAVTIDLCVLERSEIITMRAVKSKWYFWLTAWVNMVNGGPWRMSRSGRLRVRKAKGGKGVVEDAVKLA